MSRTTTTPPATAPPAAAATRSLLACAALASFLVVASGAARYWQASRVEAELRAHRESPFPLEELPMSVGEWRGEKTELDPLIVARTGSNDLITRRYVNRSTGVSVELIAMHGPAADIFIHGPDNCYPRAGYEFYGDSIEREIPLPDGPAKFRSLGFSKGDPARPDMQEVFYSWRYNGRWTPQIDGIKKMERVAGMYKVQVSRRLSPTESRAVANPCEDFLDKFMPAIEGRIRGQAPPPPAAVAGPVGAPAAQRDATTPGATER